MTHEWACAVWMHDTGFYVVCFQSVNGYAHDLLTQAAKNAAGTGVLA
jgi:sarcosine oxidase subunit gamma